MKGKRGIMSKVNCGLRMGAAAFVAGLSLVGTPGPAVAVAETAEDAGTHSAGKAETGRTGRSDAGASRPSADKAPPAVAVLGSGSAVNSSMQRRAGRIASQDRSALTSVLDRRARPSAPFLPTIPSVLAESVSPAAALPERPQAASGGPSAALVGPDVAPAVAKVPVVPLPASVQPAAAAAIKTALINTGVISMVSPPGAAAVASTTADAVAAAPSITASVTGALDNAANWLSGRPGESAAAFLQGALLLVRRHLFGGLTTAPAAATVSVLVDDKLPITVSPTNSFRTIYGTIAAGSVTINGHTWFADPKTHLYTTTADLAEEWQTYYSEMQAGRGAELNDVQRLAGNAQAVFENTDLKFQPEAQLSVARQDVQKVLDAVYAAMIGAGVDPSSTLTEDQYLAIGAVLQNNPTLRELAVQGHGLNNAWIPRYAGFTRHFQNNVDRQTRFIGAGFNSGQRALADFFDDNIITHLPFPTVVHNGVLWQLNQNGNREATVDDSVAALNESLTTTYTSDDFRQPPALVNKTPNQALEAGQPFSFALPDDTFVDPQGEDITYTATRIFGIPLPKWLSFDAQTGEFSGTAPGWRIALVFVKATNSSGLSRTEAFFVHTK